MRWKAAGLVFALTGLACASGGGPRDEGTDVAPARSRSSETLTRDEMIAINARDLHEAVRRLRPSWLRQRPSVRSSASELRVFMNSQDVGGVLFLETVRPEGVVELRFVNAIDAQVSYGPQYGVGVIVIVTRAN